MKQPWLPITPAVLVCAAFPVLFVLAPDGLPVVYAGCVGAPVNGTVTGLTMLDCRNCSSPGTEGISVSNCSITKTVGKCEINASVTVSITTGCDALWYKACGAVPCGVNGFSLARQGPATNQTISTTLDCGADQDFMELYLVQSQGENGTQACDCTPVGSSQGQPLLSGQGTCDLP